MNKQKKVQELEKRIKEMQEIYKSDVKESYNEAQQTQEVIHHLQRQLDSLRKDNDNNGSGQVFSLKKGTKNRVFIVGEIANPSRGMITEDSPIGEQLLNSDPGDNIIIGIDEWTVE
jgi:transcription elongation GreA/GreB family factor